MRALTLLLSLSLSVFFLTGCGSSDKKSDKMSKAEGKMEEMKEKSKEMMASDSKIACKLKGEVRNIEVVKNDQGCSVQYTKGGTTNEVASGGLSSAHCDNVASRIKSNLESANYSCN